MGSDDEFDYAGSGTDEMDHDHMEDFEQDDDDGGSSIDDTSFEPIVTGKGKHKAWQVDYKCLSVTDLERLQREDAIAVAGILALEPSQAIILLRHFGWNKDKLIERYMDSSERCNAEAGLETGRQPRLKRMRGFVCEICFDDVSGGETIALTCNHRFCRDCYTQYLEGKIAEGESRRIQCMQSNCKLIVDEKTVELLVPLATADKYKRLLNRTYVDDSSNLRWCPAPNCEFAVQAHVPAKSLDTIVPSVTCQCGHSFCFGCGLTDHAPCVCPLVKKWLKKCADDSETANWISANTKECPKCVATIEKNGGCNHMTCKKCKYEFCWVCMGEWSAHGTSWYNCNRYEEKGDANKDATSKSRASLERYLFYYNRYANHEQSAKLEKETYVKIEKKMEEMQNNSTLSWIEVQFLKKAVDTLSSCRATLRWSYAHAFYLVKNNLTSIFEDNQADLEHAVEELSGLIEKPIEPETIAQLRVDVTNKSAYVHKRHDIMLDDTLARSLEGAWEYQVEVA